MSGLDDRIHCNYNSVGVFVAMSFIYSPAQIAVPSAKSVAMDVVGLKKIKFQATFITAVMPLRYHALTMDVDPVEVPCSSTLPMEADPGITSF